MTLTVRSAAVTGATTKGSALTHAEMDANWAHVIQSSNQSFVPSGTGAITTETVQAALRRMVFSGQYSTAGNFNTAQAALTDTAGFKRIRLGAGLADGIVFPTTGNSPFQFSAESNTFNGTIDPQLHMAYNYGRAVATDASLDLTMEGDYNDGSGHFMELNLNYTSSDGLTGLRFMDLDVNRATHIARWSFAGSLVRLESIINGNEFVFTTATGNLTRTVADGTTSTPVAAITLANSNGILGTAGPSLLWDVGGGGGRCSIYPTRLGTAGGILHIATETTGGVMTDRIVITELGQVETTSGTKDNPGITFINDSDTGLFTRTANTLFATAGTNEVLQLNSSGQLSIGGSSANIGLSGNTLNSAAADTILVRDGAANTLALKNSNNAQTFRYYGGNGGFAAFVSFNELLTIAAAATTDSTTTIPAGAIILSASVRVTTVIPTAATFTVTTATGGTTLSTAAVSVAANSTDAGTAGGALYTAAGTKIRITPNLTPGAATGVVRIDGYYFLPTPPTS